ncbi:photosystem II repair protein PSB27-H1, chloroplastic [Elaeis guineensis]|uniref:Photosystem II repair protein PSB27-H1, chloroplastic n=1 Tax=Elaeis guineensis var. tenera TaxID=51953 RepID=A0A6I9RJ57_ELAGV|nr:photosystem II repair protein PSB27-H1, chloroplastic [Elaeis guineensis]
MASPPLLTQPTTKRTPPPVASSLPSKPSVPLATMTSARHIARREFAISMAAGVLSTSALLMLPAAVPLAALASSDEEYVRETTEVINKVRSTINMDRADPNVAAAVADLREASNTWVAKYRREKALLGRVSFRDMYSALNAVSGHYISFGPTAPIPAKRKARILEEMDTAEKALLRGR